MGRSLSLAMAALVAPVAGQRYIDVTTLDPLVTSNPWRMEDTSTAGCTKFNYAACPNGIVSANAPGWAATTTGSWLGQASAVPPAPATVSYMLPVTLSSADAPCASISVKVAADDGASIGVIKAGDTTVTYFPVNPGQSNSATAGFGTYPSWTDMPIPDVGYFAAGENVLVITMINWGGGAGAIALEGDIVFNCPPVAPQPASPSPPPPPPPPSPPSPPQPPYAPGASAVLDPHLSFAHGGRADMKGEHNTWYNMLSAKNVSVNVLFEHADFHNPFRLVHGSRMSKLGMTMRTALTGQLVTISFNATASGVQRALVTSPAGSRYVDHGHAEFAIENLKLNMREKKMGGVGGHGMALTISTGKWEVQVFSKRFPNAAANPGKALLNVAINAKYDADHDVVAPHGLIGQSYDGDEFDFVGKTDDYHGTEVTTTAMAEGAIEGVAADYKMTGPFATAFKYTRFDATAAKPRDASKLTGLKQASAKVGFGSTGALPDVPGED